MSRGVARAHLQARGMSGRDVEASSAPQLAFSAQAQSSPHWEEALFGFAGSNNTFSRSLVWHRSGHLTVNRPKPMSTISAESAETPHRRSVSKQIYKAALVFAWGLNHPRYHNPITFSNIDSQEEDGRLQKSESSGPASVDVLLSSFAGDQSSSPRPLSLNSGVAGWPLCVVLTSTSCSV